MKIFIPFLMLMFVSMKPAYSFTAIELHNKCKDEKNNIAMIECYNYISGFNSGINYTRMFFTTDDFQLPSPICVPENVTNQQMALIFNNWANENPDKVHLLATTGLGASLTNAFCKE